MSNYCSEEEQIVMTPTIRSQGHITIKMERLKPKEMEHQNIMHIAGGDHTGIVITQGSAYGHSESAPPELFLGLKVMLKSMSNNRKQQENWMLKFWFKEEVPESERIENAQVFCTELVAFDGFPKDYVDFIKRTLKLMQLKYPSVQKVEVEMKKLDEAKEKRKKEESKAKKRVIEQNHEDNYKTDTMRARRKAEDMRELQRTEDAGERSNVEIIRSGKPGSSTEVHKNGDMYVVDITDSMRARKRKEDSWSNQDSDDIRPPSAEEMRHMQKMEELRRLKEIEELRERQKAEDLRQLQKAEELRRLQEIEELRERQKAEDLRQLQKAEELRRLQIQKAEELRLQKAEELRQMQRAEELRQLQKAEELRLQKAEELRLQKAEELRQLQNAEELRLQKAEELRQMQKAEELRQFQRAEELRLQKAEELREMQKAEELRQFQRAEELRLQKAEELREMQKAEELRLLQRAEELRAQKTEELRQMHKADELRQLQKAEELRKLKKAEEFRHMQQMQKAEETRQLQKAEELRQLQRAEELRQLQTAEDVKLRQKCPELAERIESDIRENRRRIDSSREVPKAGDWRETYKTDTLRAKKKAEEFRERQKIDDMEDPNKAGTMKATKIVVTEVGQSGDELKETDTMKARKKFREGKDAEKVAAKKFFYADLSSVEKQLLEVVESVYPNSLSLCAIAKALDIPEDDEIFQKLTDLQNKGYLKCMKNGNFMRITGNDTEIKMVRQLPMVPPAQQPIIAIITAHFCEKLAVDTMMDEKETFVKFRTEGESQVYTLGKVGAHRVVSTKLPAIGHDRGPIIAAGSTTTRLLGSFSRVEYVFLVGIGGGVAHYTDYTKHVRLGDVVISTPPDAQRSYIYMYCEPQKDSSESSEDIADRLSIKTWAPPCMQLQQITLNLWQQGLGNPRARVWERFLEQGLRQLQDTESSFCRPSPETDKLYMSLGEELIEFGHPQPAEGSFDPRTPGMPVLHFGAVGSGRVLMHDDTTRLEFADRHGILAFDTEFDAVVESIFGNRKDNYVFIRGISDYKDGTKKKEWQSYAALAAASVMKAIICNLEPCD